MNAFPLLAAFTLCVSFAVLRASFDDLRAAPLALDSRGAKAALLGLERAPMPGGTPAVPRDFGTADDGLMNRELASADPLQAWLDRYLTPAE